ncbi:MAG TPA: adenylyl-sulfate kinase [Anaeromyxobacteraceae bacterium]|nr:adenylyl-sulfate kinase [Anaeromyxobacteraceae bacterium]
MSAAGGAVVWVTGLPSSGKSTFAARLAGRLRAGGRPVALLDGDAVRAALVPAPGYDPAGRAAFYATLANLAALLAGGGLVAIVAATAHRRAFRDAARAAAPRFVEVLVDAAPEVCAARDAKGLWARARAGGAPELPGAGVAYERPVRPEVVARGGEDDAAVEAALRLL